MNRTLLLAVLVNSLVATVGCGVKECVLNDPKACDTGFVCESVQGREKPLCVRPVEIHGKVFDLESGAGISGALVTAQDENGAPVGDVVTTGSDGSYSVSVPSNRTDDQGAFVSRKVTLSAAAQNYARFPSGIRTAIPVDTAGATRSGNNDPFVLSGAAADIGLAKLPASEQNLPSISGTVALGGQGRSALVVAQSSVGVSPVGRSAVAAGNGSFTLFNVPAGDYTLRAYTRGVNYDPVNVTVATSNVTGVSIAQNSVAPATVSGSIQIVAGSGTTSVILAVKGTFDPESLHGEAPVGLRAPEPGNPPNLGPGTFSISGVPDGEYVALAGFENDGMVRDPDTSQGGTSIQYVTVTNGTASALDAFKVTDAVIMVGPGVDGIETTTATPTFTWQKYPSTDHYDVVVIDALGNVHWSTTVRSAGGGTATLTYAGPELKPGGIYQWRAVSVDNSNVPLSTTEDLRGVFQVAR